MLRTPSEQKTRRRTQWAVCILASAIPGLSALAADSAPASVPPAEYHPSMGDLMTLAVQPRHIKLGLAGQAGNWVYATYELSELRNAFARIARTIPQYQNADTATAISAMTQAPLGVVEAAVKAKDRAQFTQAFAQLTAVCNACHVAQNHPMVVIQVPTGRFYPDQNFQPADAK
jgi:hypothetical protein